MLEVVMINRLGRNGFFVPMKSRFKNDSMVNESG